jgi:serine protease Do
LVLASCKMTFAEQKRPVVTLGAKENPRANEGAALGSFRSVFADIAQSVVPTVVSVIPTKIDTVVFSNNPFYDFFGDQFGGSPFDFFFGNPREGNKRERPKMEKQERRMQGLGSGVIVSEDGYILTNFHVVSGANEIEVKLNDGRQFEADIIGSDSLSDVAVIKIRGKVHDLPVAYLGDSDKLRPGDWVIAIGNPFSLTSTVTAGIVSALGRSVSGGAAYQNFIQTDAAINPGNSGGALVNIDGELVGINTMIYTNSGGYMGIGFAIPINMAREDMSDLIAHGEVVRGWIGVTIQDIDGPTRDALDLGDVQGVLVGDVLKGQPADKAGLRSGDVVLSIDRKKVSTANELRNVVAALNPGAKVPVEVLRGKKQVSLRLTIARRNEKTVSESESAAASGATGSGKEKAATHLGIKVSNITPELRTTYHLDAETRGVVIVGVESGFTDGRRALKEGDIIRAVKLKDRAMVDVASVKEFTKAVHGVKKGESVMLMVERNSASFFIAFRADD